MGSEMMIHGLFGGAKSREQNNSLYKRKVYSQTVICRKIPRLKREPWTIESKEQRIWFLLCSHGSYKLNPLVILHQH